MRIVSLVPSLTHLLVDLGLKDAVIGCTKFCVQPPDMHRASTLCGGTKDPDLDLIASLKPSHIMVNEEENKPEHIEALGKIALVLNTFPKSPDEVPTLIGDVCRFLGVRDERDLSGTIERLLAEVRALVKVSQRKSFAYFIWRNPWMVVGEDTYINRMLELLGWENICKSDSRYPEVTLPLKKPTPDVILFSTEPYPFRKRDVQSLEQEWPDHPQVLKIDGMLCSWYGSMTITALEEAKKYCRGAPQQLFSEFG